MSAFWGDEKVVVVRAYNFENILTAAEFDVSKNKQTWVGKTMRLSVNSKWSQIVSVVLPASGATC